MSRTIKHAYTKAKAISKHCRNSSGKCYYCVGNRTYKNNKISTINLKQNNNEKRKGHERLWKQRKCR